MRYIPIAHIHAHVHARVRAGLVALAALAVASCAPLTQTVDRKTGTTIAQRCAARVLALDQFRAQPEFAASATMQGIARAYDGYTRLICPPPWGLAAASTPPMPSTSVPAISAAPITPVSPAAPDRPPAPAAPAPPGAG